MAFKFIIVLALSSIAHAGDLSVGAPTYTAAYARPQYAFPAQVAAPAFGPAYVKSIETPAYYKAIASPVAKQVEYEAPAKYDFSYGVNDPHTGDVKEQSESRDGDVVHGSYSLIDADGYKRTVEYTADEHNGFNAVVHREPLGHAAPVVKSVAPVAKVVGPVAHYGPAVSQNAYAVPTTYAAQPAYATSAYATPAYAGNVHYTAPAVTKVVTPGAYAAPAFTKVVSPASYAAPSVYSVPSSYAAPAYTKVISQAPQYAFAKAATPVASYGHYAPAPVAYNAPIYQH